MNWSHQTVLVTGAGGFIGSHLTERLAVLGARTRALIHYNSANSWGWLDKSSAAGDVEVFLGDLREPDSLQSAVKGVDVIYHLGALIGIPYSYESPLSYLHTNVEGTLNMLQAAMDVGVSRFVHTSTSEVYGTAQYIPMDEGHPLQSQSPYAASKTGADKMAEAFHLSFQLPVTIIRPFNTYGPRQSSRAIIPTIVTQAHDGNAIRLGNLDPTRDFNYVEDTVEGFISALASENTVGELINLGSGQKTSIGELAKTILALIGTDLPIEFDQQRARPHDSEVERLCADNRKALELCGWCPQVS